MNSQTCHQAFPTSLSHLLPTASGTGYPKLDDALPPHNLQPGNFSFRHAPQPSQVPIDGNPGEDAGNQDQAADAERLRLEALSRYQAFGALRGAAFDDLARVAAFVCQTPISLVSLVDGRRQWFLSAAGIDVCETSRDVSFCTHALIGPDMMVVSDAQADARFAGNPFVTAEPHIRFYAGVPLVTPDGYTLGTLCVIDRVPRTLTREQKEALTSLSRLTMAQLEMHRLKQSLLNHA